VLGNVGIGRAALFSPAEKTIDRTALGCVKLVEVDRQIDNTFKLIGYRQCIAGGEQFARFGHGRF
jgi:hypothetical protein